MTRAGKTPSPKPKLPGICHRVGELLQRLWEGNVAQMARDLKVSYPAMLRVLGGQIPSGKILQGLAEHPGVNAAWLLSGEDRSPAVAHRTCSVAKQLLPGPPNEHPEKLDVGLLPVASLHPLFAAYWYQVRASDAVANTGESNVMAGDFLLIETSLQWTRRPEAYAGRLCVLRLPERDKPVLGRVAVNEEYFDDGARAVDVVGEKTSCVLFASAKSDVQQKPNPDSRAVELYLNDVLGVCLQLVRVF